MSAVESEAVPRAPGTFPTLAEALPVWTRIALLSFGGPAGQIAVMHRILVEEKRWIGDDRFLHALNFCMLLPGPEAQQLATYVGWLMHRTIGGLVAGILFVLPGAVTIMALSVVYALYGNVGPVAGLFDGLKAAVLAIVLQAVVRIGRRALKGPAMVAIAALAFVAIFAFGVPFPLIIAAAAVAGIVLARAGPAAGGGGHGATRGPRVDDALTALGTGVPAHARPSGRQAATGAAILLALWLGPTLLLLAALGPKNVFSEIAVFFSTMAVVTFGGAYAVLAYVAQEAVGTYGWLQPGEMLDGLGLAETTPGPLIMVTQFVGFLGAYRDPGGLPPLVAGVLGGVLTTWVTFVPCFLWVFAGGPFMERLRSNRTLSAALGAITAAVVGVVLNLALWFSMHVLFEETRRVTAMGLDTEVPVLTSLDPIAAVFAAGALVAVFVMRVSLFAVLGGAAVAGALVHFAGLS
ncbi:chromate transporter [Acuticoccus sediminis]|uniref:Chromate transporter n=1 Tax=Acuticoccus sediminis TaxID=2184697 RepID=A0A8B2NQT6_9HYPH|nr:chromate efflux transporter [Acuticoccus sediminis]RAH97359.1 chromate transporter [Acuticoccus sediminis]